MEILAELPVTADHIRSWMRRDPSLSAVVQCLQQGWPDKSDPKHAPYFSRKTELSLCCA